MRSADSLRQVDFGSHGVEINNFHLYSSYMSAIFMWGARNEKKKNDNKTEFCKRFTLTKNVRDLNTYWGAGPPILKLTSP